MTEMEKAEQKLATLEEELARLRQEYRAAAEGARPRELRILAQRGREIADRVEQGRQWIAEREEGEAA